MLLSDVLLLIESNNNKRNKFLFFRQTIDSIFKKFENKIIISFDVETTGLSVNLPWTQVTEIGAIAFDAISGQEIDRFHHKVKLTDSTKREMEIQKRNQTDTDRGALSGPKSPAITDTLKLTQYGLKNAEYVDILEMYKQWAEWINSFDNPILLGQNVGFDMGHMFAPLKKYGITRPKFAEVLDTLTIARVWIYPLLKAGASMGDEISIGMLDACNVTYPNGRVGQSFTLKQLGKIFNVPTKNWHVGIADAQQTYEIFCKMMDFLMYAKEREYDSSEEFKQSHASMSNKAFYYGKQPAFQDTIKSQTKKGIEARGNPRKI